MAERVLVVGEALVDIVHRRDGSVDEHAGGSPLNVAIGLARLGHEVQFASRFGRDRYGEIIRAHLARESLLSLTPGTDQAEHTSTARATLDVRGAATYEFDLVWDVAAALDHAPVGHLHTGSIGATVYPGALAVYQRAKEVRETGTISYDPNARPTLMGTPEQALGLIEPFVALSDVVKASDEDLLWLYPDQRPEDVMARWIDQGVCLAVLTLGGLGALAMTADGRSERMPAEGASVIDTVGAGDSFMSGLISGLIDLQLVGDVNARDRLRAASLEAVRPALDRAARCAAITVSRAGANPPTRAELTT